MVGKKKIKKKKIAVTCLGIITIQHWLPLRPHKGGNFYPKTPTLSVYKRSDPTVMVEWGHGAKKMMLKPQAAKENIILAGFKLNLDETLHRGMAENHRYSSIIVGSTYFRILIFL